MAKGGGSDAYFIFTDLVDSSVADTEEQKEVTPGYWSALYCVLR